MGQIDPHSDFKPDLMWAYSRASHAVKFVTLNVRVDFLSGRVGQVSASAKYFWNDASAAYVLRQGFLGESPEFAARFCR